MRRAEIAVPTVVEPGAPWNPAGIGWMSALLSFLPAGMLWALNWGRLGQPDKVRSRLVWVVALFAVFLPAAFWAPDRMNPIFVVVNCSIAAFFHKSQKELFAAHVARGGARARFLKPVLLSLLGLGLVFATLLALLLPGALRADAELEAGNRRLGAGDAQGALEAFNRAREAAPDEPAVHWELARAYTAMGRHDDARRELEALRRIDPAFRADNGDTIERHLALVDEAREVHLGNERIDAGDHEAARRHFEKAKAAVPDDAAARWNLALVFRRTGRWDEAQRELADLARIAPGWRGHDGSTVEDELREVEYDRQFEGGTRRLELQDGPGAVETFGRLAVVLPEDPSVRWNLALAYEQAGRLDDALREVDVVRRLDPEGGTIDTARVDRKILELRGGQH